MENLNIKDGEFIFALYSNKEIINEVYTISYINTVEVRFVKKK